MESKYNLKCPAVKRLMREAAELRESTEHYHAQPLEDNLFEWHFTIRGPSDSIYSEGLYHGRLVFPTQYPLKPPSVIMLTPNGRFDVNTRICLSISDYHPETWQPSWSIRTALLALITFMVTESEGSIGALNYTQAERKALAQNSLQWKCPDCGSINHILKDRSNVALSDNKELQKDCELAKQITFQRSTNGNSVTNSTDDTLTTGSISDSMPSTHQPLDNATNGLSNQTLHSDSISISSNNEPVVPTTASTFDQVQTNTGVRPSFQTRHPYVNRLLRSNITALAVFCALVALIVRRINRND